MTTLAAAAHAHQHTISPQGLLLLLALTTALYLLALWAGARLSRARLSRAVTRAYAPGKSARRSATRAHRLAGRAMASRRTGRRFHKAVFISAVIAAVWLFAQLHPHTH
jgi:hypothetical protein